MELAYLCCARQGDILEMKKGQLIDRGILIQQSKTAVSQIKAWTDRLRAAIDLAGKLPLSSGMVSIFVLHQQSGSRYTRDSFNAHWMKAKGISDLEGTLSDKQAISGHKNATQTARYDRKIAVVPVVGGQK